MAERNVVDAWAQPVLGRTRADLPEAVRLLEKSGTVHLLDQKLPPAQLVSFMDAAGVQTLMLSAWSRWLITNDEVANHCTEFPDLWFAKTSYEQSLVLVTMLQAFV